MIHMTMIHWIVLAIFVLLFIVLTLLAAREKNVKSMLIMIFSSFLLTTTAAVISLIVVDKYTKKAKIITYKTQRDLTHESVNIRGTIQNVGNFTIEYCTLEIRISNNPVGKRASSYFTPTKSFDFMGDVGSRKNSITVEEDIARHLDPGEKKSFITTVRIPSYFENPKYYLKLHCH